MQIETLKLPESVRQGFIDYSFPLVDDPKYDPYKPENFAQIRYALERKMWQLLKNVPENEKQEADAIISAIEKQRSANGDPAFIIDHFPIDENIPATPIEKEKSTGINGKGIVSELALMAIHSLLDREPYIIEGLRGSLPVNQIVPVKGEEGNKASSMGSKENFAPHTDGSPDNNPPEYLSLVALRNEEHASTNLGSVEDLLKKFSADEIETMKKPIFSFNTGSAFASYKEINNLPMLTFNENGKPLIRINLAGSRTDSSTGEGKDIIAKLTELTDPDKHQDFVEKIVLQKGQALFFDNKRCFHSRDAFERNYDQANSRWLQRIVSNYRPDLRAGEFPSR